MSYTMMAPYREELCHHGNCAASPFQEPTEAPLKNVPLILLYLSWPAVSLYVGRGGGGEGGKGRDCLHALASSIISVPLAHQIFITYFLPSQTMFFTLRSTPADMSACSC